MAPSALCCALVDSFSHRHLSDKCTPLQVGGLRDTVSQFNPSSNTGTGWTFEWADSGNFRNAIGNGMYTYREYKDSFRSIQRRGMSQNLTWDNAAAQYEEVLLAGKYQW